MDTSLEVKQIEPDNNKQNDGLIRFYPIRNRNLKHWIAVPTGILLLLLAFTSLLYGFFTTWTMIGQHGRAMILQTFPTFLLIAGLAFLIGVILLGSTAKHWNDGIGIYPTGITIHQGRKPLFVPWESVTRFDTRIKLIKFATSVMEVRSTILLETEDLKQFKITDRIADMRNLVQQCREQLLPRLYEKSLLALRHDEKLEFHRQLSVRQSTLIVKGQSLSWEGLEPVINNRTLAIRQLSTQKIVFKGNINRFRNTDIFLALLENPPVN